MAIWSRLTGAIAGLGIGGAAATAFEPAFEVPRQVAWEGEPNRILDLGTLAHLIAQGLLDEGAAENEAARNGYNPNRLRAMVQVQLKAPDVAEALALWRRGRITEAQVDHALAKSQLEQQYHGAVKELEFGRLDPAVVATAVQRGILPNEGILPVGPPTARGVVEPMPMVDLDPFAEAFASGVNAERLKVEARIVGLPPGPGELLDLLNRGVIERADFLRGVAEGNTRNEWADVLEQLRHYLLSPGQAATLRLKGWKTRAEANALGALRGASAEVMDDLYLAQGRPAAPVQMQTAWARGVDGPDGTPMDRAQFEKGIRESDIRPEWAAMLWGIRFAYPPLFQINRLVQGHAITPAVAVEWATKDRYAPEVLHALAAYWASGTTAAQKEATAATLLDEYEGLFIDEQTLRSALGQLGYHDAALDMEVHLADARRVKKARDAVVKAIHDSYVAHNLTDADAEARLADEQISAEAQALLVREWSHERGVARKTLTPAQIKRAYARNVITLDAAVAELVEHGYTDASARTYLAE